MYDEGGWMPKWPNPTYSNIMIGTHSDAVVADAFVKNFRNVYNSETGFMSARNYDGSFLTNVGSHVDEVEQIVEEGITEGGSWTYLFCSMQDVPGLISLMGGKDKFTNMLDQNFDEGHFQHRNEPCHRFIYLYNYAGNPSKTQEKIWEHTPLNYKNAPDGLSGNDDCGQMSAWYIFSSMGFYPVCPGNGQYSIGSPLFPKITLQLPAPYNKNITIIAEGVTEGNKYIKSLTMNGKPIITPFIKHDDLVSCNELIFKMSGAPTDWGK